MGADEDEVLVRFVGVDATGAAAASATANVQGVQTATTQMGVSSAAAIDMPTASLRTYASAASSAHYILREMGLGGVASMLAMGTHALHLAHAVERIGAVARTSKVEVEGLAAAQRAAGAARGGAGFAAAEGAGMAMSGGVMIAGVAALVAATAAISILAARSQSTAPSTAGDTIVNVNVDARGTLSDHRALADRIAKETEGRISARSRFPGND